MNVIGNELQLQKGSYSRSLFFDKIFDKSSINYDLYN